VLWRLILSPNGVVNYIAEVIGYAGPRIEWVSSRKLALYSLIFINIWAGYPFFMTSLLAGLQGISADFYEAATVDGANGIQKFLYITIPQLMPIILSMAMLDMIWTTQQFSLVWMITGGGPVNSTDLLGTYIYRLAFKKYEFALASSGAVIILIIIMVMASVYVKYQKSTD
jgi:multiple sugar transport system permease protein